MDPMQNRMGVTCAKMLTLAVLVLAARATAGEYPLSGEFLHLRSQVTPGTAGIRFGATGDARQEGAPSVDPQVTGAVLEVVGDGVLGDTPPVPLPGATWRALGDPPGSRGFRYLDSSDRFGVRKVSLRFGTRMSLSIYGGGRAWPYRTSGVPGAVTVRLHIGDEVFCARFGTFKRGPSGAMCATHNPPPATCRYVS